MRALRLRSPVTAAFARRAWPRTLAVGLVLYLVITVAAVATDNLRLFPSVILLGALLIPVTFVVYVFERVPIGAEVLPAVAGCFVVGGLVGTAAASLLEYETLRDLGGLWMVGVGLIEESVKLAFPVALYRRRRFTAPPAGVLFGVTAGMGFAALESMGYGLAALVQSHGRIGITEAVLALRGVLSPTGHAAWTGLVCAALWRARGWRWTAAAFLTAVTLHTLWDATDSIPLRGAVALVSTALLTMQLSGLRGARWTARPRELIGISSIGPSMEDVPQPFEGRSRHVQARPS